MCAKYKCEEPDSNVEMVGYSYALMGLVQGLGTLSPSQVTILTGAT